MTTTTTPQTTRPAPGTRLRGFSSSVILVTGVMLVPMALVLAFNSYGPPDAEAYVRMAFAQVAGSVVAICTAVGLFVQRLIARSPLVDVAWFAFLALVIAAWQWSALSAASATLLRNLGV